MNHPAFRRQLLANATPYDFPGVTRGVQFDRGLTYPVGDGFESAWEGGYEGPNGPADWSTRWQSWDPGRLEKLAASISEPIFVLNIEHYGPNGIGRLIDLLEFIRSRRPDVALGIWSLLPKSNFTLVNDYAQYIDFKAGRPHYTRPKSWWEHPDIGPTRVASFQAWQRENDLAARKLVPHVDFLMPSVYPVIEPASEKLAWTVAREPELMIAECRRVAPQLPVLACWYPYVSTLRKLASPLLTRTVLEACKAADGTIVWGDEHTPETATAASLSAASSS